jgi:hypothetical protein
MPPQDKQARPSRKENFEEEEDKYHRLCWCPDGLSHSQKHRVQQLCNLEEAEAQYLEMLRKAHPDLAVKVHCTQKKESHPRKKEWRPKPTKVDGTALAGTNMVFVLPLEFYAPDRKELPVAQLDFGLWPVIFEKARERNYKHLKALYLKGYINGHLVNKMLVDTGAAVKIMAYSVLRRLAHSTEDLIKTNVMLSDFNGQASEAQGVLNVDLTVGSKTVLTFVNCCIPSMMHQCLIQWDGDEVEVVHADDSIEISLAAMSVWDIEDQESISGISLEGCDRVEATKNDVRLVLSTSLTE